MAACLAVIALAALAGAGPATAAASPSATATARATTLKVAWVGGDSMAYQIRPTLQARLLAMGVARIPWFCKSSTGLVRTDFFNWPVKARQALRAAHPQAAFFMIGTNDAQGMTVGGHVYDFGGADWKRVYRIRVAGVMRAMLQSGATHVYWMGMPIMRSSVFGARMRVLNAIFESEAASHPGVTYVDTWKLFSGSNGAFVSGWRAADGIHFNMAGVNRLVDALVARVRADW